MITKHLKVIGHVQGVGFRAYTRRTAEENGVTGWVKNMDDDSVEMILQGDEEDVQTVVHAVHDGSPVSTVDTVEQRVVDDADNHDTFSIRY